MFVAIGLLIAAFSIVRRSRLALLYGGTIRTIIVLEIVLRVVGWLAPPPTVGLWCSCSPRPQHLRLLVRESGATSQFYSVEPDSRSAGACPGALVPLFVLATVYP